MGLTPEQIKQLMDSVASSKEDCLDCDGCFVRIAEFAEAHLAGRELCEAMRSVKVHLESCHCCQDEFEALLDALRGLDEKAAGDCP